VLRSFNRHSTDRGFVQSNSFQSVRRATVLTTKLHAPKDHYSRGETSERILFILSWSDRRRATCGVTPPAPVQNERYRTPAILDFLGAWRRTFAATRGFVIEKKDRYRIGCGPAICGSCGRFGQSCFGENKIKNTNQASRQDRVENGDRISS
jgi:hypothetical protein